MKYTSEVFQRLGKGQFLSANSTDAALRAIYNDVEEDFEAYREYFDKIDFTLSNGNGYFYFSRREPRVNIENKLQSLFSWIDYLDFLKTYDTSFGPGTQFTILQLELRLSTEPGLKEKLSGMFRERNSNRQKLEALVKEMEQKGFAELINEAEELYHVTNAFSYIEQIILCINIDEEIKDEIPE